MSKGAKIVVSILAVLLLAYGTYFLAKGAPIASAYTAKILCSAVFVAGRDVAQVLDEDLEAFGYISASVDFDTFSVTASLLGLGERRAVYQPGLGCTRLEHIDTPLPWAAAAFATDRLLAGSKNTRGRNWPGGDLDAEAGPDADIDRRTLEGALAHAFLEDDSGVLRRTRAVVVVNRGRIVAERYAGGFFEDTPLIGWSMTKSITNALVGILVRQGKLDVHAPATVGEWQAQDDPRRAITLDQLMRMSSGLRFDEGYDGPFNDAVAMLFGATDAAAFAAAQPLDFVPDTHWSYSSGTTNIISRIVREAAGGPHPYYLSFPQRELFDRIGMHSAVMEPDTSGTFVGSSFSYATARDWARFGMLYLNDGVWEGERILPEGWIDYTRRPTPTAPRGQYGAQFWMDAGYGPEREHRRWSELPADAYFASGYEGQSVMIVPSRDTVIVRLGLSQTDEAWDPGAFAVEVLQALP